MAVTKARSNAVAKAAKGDLSVGSGTNASSILAVGTDAQILVADSTAATGLKWAAAGTSFTTASSYVATIESTSSTTFTNLTTTQSVTLTTGTKALVVMRSTVQNGAVANAGGLVSYAVSGATTIAAGTNISYGNIYQGASANTQLMLGASFLVTGLTAGSNTFTMKFADVEGKTSYFGYRTISVIDLGS